MEMTDELTRGGARRLRQAREHDAAESVVLQVLGVYRYVNDDNVRSLLSGEDGARSERDVFDVLLSDGEQKLKCVLASKLNRLVRQEEIREMAAVRVVQWRVLSIEHEAETEHGTTRSVTVVQALEVEPSTKMSGAKIIHATASTARTPSPRRSSLAPDVGFLSMEFLREHAAIPLLGERLYYLPLRSDKYPFHEDPGRPAELTPAEQVEPWLAWNTQRHFSTHMLQGETKVIHTIREVNTLTSQKKRKNWAREATAEVPPMIGVVQYKSQLIHLGTPDAPHVFPYMFHVVLADGERGIEVAFFGSKAAKYFLTVQEGDVVEVEGFSVTRSPFTELNTGNNPNKKKMYFLPHLSRGSLSHVPEKYWKLLEATALLPEMQGPSTPNDTDNEDDQQDTVPGHFLDLAFMTTLDEHPSDEDDEEGGRIYCDFVGVVSYVGRVFWSASHESAPRDEYRWIKVIDSSSCTELPVKLQMGSQPDAFREIRAGNAVMLTKICWVTSENCVAEPPHAVTSNFTVLRLNESVTAFRAYEEVKMILDFRKDFCAHAQPQERGDASPSCNETWLAGPPMENYHPNDVLPRSLKNFAFFFRVQTVTLSDLDKLCDDMVSMDQRHVLVRTHLLHVSSREGSHGIETELEIGDAGGYLHRRSARVCPHPLFRPSEPPAEIAEMIDPEAIDLLQVLPPTLLEELVATHGLARQQFRTPQRGQRRSSISSISTLTLEQVVERLRTTTTDGLTFSLHLYRSVDSMDAHIDAIFV